jgi:hypothetical protein
MHFQHANVNGSKHSLSLNPTFSFEIYLTCSRLLSLSFTSCINVLFTLFLKWKAPTGFTPSLAWFIIMVHNEFRKSPQQYTFPGVLYLVMSCRPGVWTSAQDNFPGVLHLVMSCLGCVGCSASWFCWLWHQSGVWEYCCWQQAYSCFSFVMTIVAYCWYLVVMTIVPYYWYFYCCFYFSKIFKHHWHL